MREDFLVPEGVYLDSACTSLRLASVFEAQKQYLQTLSSCSGRSSHKLSTEVDKQVHSTRKAVHSFFSASKKQSVVFTKNATESLNVVGRCMDFGPNDVIITSHKEHNSNHLVWMQAAKRSGCKHVLLSAQPDISLDELQEVLEKYAGRVKVISLVHVSNVDGSELDVKRVSKLAKKHSAFFVLDACQSAGHQEVVASQADFVAFSAHKMLASSLGVLIAPTNWLDQTDPLIIGGGSVVSSTATDFVYADPVEKFEAGLQNYQAIIGLKPAITYLKKTTVKRIHKHTSALVAQVQEAFAADSRIDMFGQGSICSFTIGGVSPQEVALLLNERDIFVRAGMHCAHTYFEHIGLVDGCVRASFHMYNTKQDAQALIDALNEILEVVC